MSSRSEMRRAPALAVSSTATERRAGACEARARAARGGRLVSERECAEGARDEREARSAARWVVAKPTRLEGMEEARWSSPMEEARRIE